MKLACLTASLLALYVLVIVRCDAVPSCQDVHDWILTGTVYDCGKP